MSEARNVELRAANLEGHTLRKYGKTFRCTVCDAQSRKWENIAPARCKGFPIRAWEATLKEFVNIGAQIGRGHVQRISEHGDLVYKLRCVRRPAWFVHESNLCQIMQREPALVGRPSETEAT